jgi:hypothetical protein
LFLNYFSEVATETKRQNQTEASYRIYIPLNSFHTGYYFSN